MSFYSKKSKKDREITIPPYLYTEVMMFAINKKLEANDTVFFSETIAESAQT